MTLAEAGYKVTNGFGCGMTKNVSFKINGRNHSFNIMNSPTGCGVGIFSQFYGNLTCYDPEKHPELYEVVKLALKQKYHDYVFHVIIATLGDSYTKNWEKSFASPECSHDKGLLHLGFKQIYEFENSPNHVAGYHQRIYFLDTKEAFK